MITSDAWVWAVLPNVVNLDEVCGLARLSRFRSFVWVKLMGQLISEYRTGYLQVALKKFDFKRFLDEECPLLQGEGAKGEWLFQFSKITLENGLEVPAVFTLRT